MKKQQNTMRIIGGIIAVLVLVYFASASYRNGKMIELFRVATFRENSDSVRAKHAVEELGKIRGRKSTSLLLKIATGQADGGYIWPSSRQAAIAILAKRRDPEVMTQLAAMMQPHQDLATRKALADGLVDADCPRACIAYLLHYRERIWRGDPDSEERLKPVTPFVQVSRADINANIDATLKRNSDTTVELLRSIYGLGTDDLSPFGLSLIGELNLKETCPAIIQMQQQAKRDAALGYVESPELDILSKKLGCGT